MARPKYKLETLVQVRGTDGSSYLGKVTAVITTNDGYMYRVSAEGREADEEVFETDIIAAYKPVVPREPRERKATKNGKGKSARSSRRATKDDDDQDHATQ